MEPGGRAGVYVYVPCKLRCINIVYVYMYFLYIHIVCVLLFLLYGGCILDCFTAGDWEEGWDGWDDGGWGAGTCAGIAPHGVLLGLKQPHKHRAPTKQHFFYPPHVGPWNQKVGSFCFCGLLSPCITRGSCGGRGLKAKP